MLSYLQSKSAITALLDDSGQIKELQWQGTEFTYPAVRISVDIRPSVNGCGPDNADFMIDVFDEQKSSKTTSVLSGTIANALHKIPFTSNGLKFSTVVVQKVSRPERSISAWQSTITVQTQVT
jgi:hypothetical protein